MNAIGIIPVSAAALMITHTANCQQGFPFEGDIAKGSAHVNETLYGPVKVIELPGIYHPTRFVPYPDIDPEIRKNITNGGLGIICSSCNATGCICPDTIDGLFDACEGCRGTKDGGIRCYCSPALGAGPCNTYRDRLTSCKDDPELCKKLAPVFYCEAQPWYQNPELAAMTAAAVVYDFKTMTIEPGADVTALAQQGSPAEVVQGAAGAPLTVAFSPKPQQGTSSKNIVGAGVAAAAVAVGAAFLMRP
ncbi:MAG: hypothetical protein Q9172_004780 [Xanthocarpia lactea]